MQPMVDTEVTPSTSENAVVTVAKSKALPQLRRMGLKRFDGKWAADRNGRQVTLSGQSEDELGQMRDVTFTFNVAGDDWSLVTYSLDGTRFERK